MGICDSSNESSFDDHYKKVEIDRHTKDMTKDYLLENSIRSPIKSKYQILESQVGKGAYGQIYLGIDKSGKKYAIKFIKKKKLIKGEFLANEVRIGSKMKHPNILSIKEVYEDSKTISLVMEYCADGDLFDYITKNPQEKLDDINTIDILVQILSAINYLHNEVKVSHRDIKPENFLITMTEKNRPLVKLIDFGMAQYIKKGQKMRGKIGTTMYMAPEILMKVPYDEKIDIWSTGIILYNMLTGYEPFTSGDKEFMKIQILNRPINFDIIKNDNLRNLCEEMLERDPKRRIDCRTALEKAKMIKRKISNK